jgi:hypothetical protein
MMVMARENRWRRAIADPVFFAREFLEIEPHPGQIRWLLNSTRPENLLHTGNRWGKSTAQAIKVIHRCLFKVRNPIFDRAGKYQAVNCSITLDQARIIFNTAKGLISKSPLLQMMVNCIR